MRRVFLGIALMFGLVSLAVAQDAKPQPSPQPTQPKQQTPAPPKTHLKVGDVAPDFTLIDTNRKEVKLSDFKGKKSVVLAFYILAFTGG